MLCVFLRQLSLVIAYFGPFWLTAFSCTTCRQNSWSCTGHPGHIELPVRVYNVTFFDQLYRLLRAQCVYCHRFQMARVQINAYVCKLRLLQYGLVDEVEAIEAMGTGQGNKKKSAKDADDSGSEEEDDDDLIARRNAYVKKVIREAHAAGRLKGIMSGAKNPMAAEQRRTLVKQFFKDLVSIKKCSSCSGYVMSLSLSPCYFYRLLTMCKEFHLVTGEIVSRRFSGSLCLRSLD